MNISLKRCFNPQFLVGTFILEKEFDKTAVKAAKSSQKG